VNLKRAAFGINSVVWVYTKISWKIAGAEG